MNKKLIALAVAAGLAAPMAANAAPTVYGHLQAEFADVDRNGAANDYYEIDDKKRGRLGVKGDEDLGGGLKALYKFEFQVDTTQADVDDGDREAYVGLKGGFGQVTIGSNKSPYKYYGGVKYDALVTTYLQARDSDGANGGGMFSSVSNAASLGSNGFLTDSISYKNKFGMAEFWLTYQVAESNAVNVDDNMAVGLKVSQGPWEAFVAHAVEETDAANTDSSNTKIGGKFKMGAHSIAAQIESHSDDAANSDAEAWFVSGIMGFGKNQLIVQLGETDNDQNGNANNTSDREYMAVAVKHKFSKTTSSWVGYKTTDHKNGDNSLDQDALSLGLRVTF